MTKEQILKYGEIQYLKGRLDELFKALPTVFDMSRNRKLDQRIEKYQQKLKNVDELAYYLYQVELQSRQKSKDRSKREIKELLEETLKDVSNEELLEKIKNQIDKY